MVSSPEVHSQDHVVKRIPKKAESGIFVTALGF